jgi:hypothetical protein
MVHQKIRAGGLEARGALHLELRGGNRRFADRQDPEIVGAVASPADNRGAIRGVTQQRAHGVS